MVMFTGVILLRMVRKRKIFSYDTEKTNCFPLPCIACYNRMSLSTSRKFWASRHGDRESANEPLDKRNQWGRNFSVWALFAILLVTCPINTFAIFDYHNRKRQARFCMFSMLMIIGWYIVYGVFSQVLMPGFTFHVGFAACLPLIAFILLWLARHSILADEALVRAADRIR